MNLRRHKVSESTPTTRRRRSTSLLTSDELLQNIPIDLVIEIFSRLPLKSIARCRCVSNRWASVLRRPDFTELFFAKSSTRPKLLFACRKQDKKEVVFFSTPQPQNLGEDASLLLASSDHVSFSFERVGDICISVNGYFCISDEGMKTDRHKPLGLEEIHKAQEEKRGPDIIDSVSKNRASTGRSSTEELLTKTTKPALVQNRYDALSSQCDD